MDGIERLAGRGTRILSMAVQRYAEPRALSVCTTVRKEEGSRRLDAPPVRATHQGRSISSAFATSQPRCVQQCAQTRGLFILRHTSVPLLSTGITGFEWSIYDQHMVLWLCRNYCVAFLSLRWGFCHFLDDKSDATSATLVLHSPRTVLHLSTRYDRTRPVHSPTPKSSSRSRCGSCRHLQPILRL